MGGTLVLAMDLTFTKDLSIIVAGVVAFVTFASGLLQYVKQGHQRRAENFVQMRRRFLESELFREISNLLPGDEARLATLPIQDRRNYIGFLEEVSLLVNSRLIRSEVAYVFFGYYVRLADESGNLWVDLDKGSPYWVMFRRFAEQVRSWDAQGGVGTGTLEV